MARRVMHQKQDVCMALLQAIWAACMLAAVLVLAGCSPPAASVMVPERVLVELASRQFSLELALTPEQRYQGLSDRRELAADGGMLFVFPQPEVLSFVMRRCHVPLDIVYLNASGGIVAMHEMKLEPEGTPESGLKPYSSLWPAQYAIEVRGGTLRELGLRPGQVIQIPQELKQLAR